MGTRIKRGFARGDKREKKEERAKVVFVEDALAQPKYFFLRKNRQALKRNFFDFNLSRKAWYIIMTCCAWKDLKAYVISPFSLQKETRVGIDKSTPF